MSDFFAVLLDDVVQLEFDRAATLPAPQLAYLDDMDQRMDGGIELEGERVAAPDASARTRFVAANMASALASGDDKVAVAMCTWLAVRQPELKQVKIASGEFGLTIDLDYETPYEKPEPQGQPVTFHFPKNQH